MKKLAALLVAVCFVILAIGPAAYADLDANKQRLKGLTQENNMINNAIQQRTAEIQQLQQKGLQNIGAIDLLKKIIGEEEKAVKNEALNEEIEKLVQEEPQVSE